MEGDASFLGTVQSVQGATVSVELATETAPGLAFIRGYGYRIGQIGSFVRIPMGYVDLYGIVSKVGAEAVPEALLGIEPYGRRWITVELVGEGTEAGGFQRGLSQYPTYSDKVYLVTEPDLARLYGRQDAPNFVKVGHVASTENIPALVDINKLVTRHSAVVGATGTGKSTTVAGLLISLTTGDRFRSARIMVLDIHGEYAAALKDRATVFRVNPDERNGELPLYVPYWAMSFDELLSMTLGRIDDPSQGQVVQRIYEMKRAALELRPRPGIDDKTLTVDSPVPFSIHRFWLDLHNLLNGTHPVQGAAQTPETIAYASADGVQQRGDAMQVIAPRYMPPTSGGPDRIYLSASPLNLRRQVEGLAAKLRDPRFDFMFRPGPLLPVEDGTTEGDLDSLLAEWLGGPQPIAILDLSGVPASILNDLVGVLLRLMFDALFWARGLSEGGRERPLLLVLEEAHTYLGKAEAGPASVAVQRIAKEGRKYGIGAMIVSQRPAEIDSTILSQCGTMIAMRLANALDRSHVTAAVTDNLAGLLGMLPALRTGEALIVGEAVQLPVRTIVDPPAKNRRPDSVDPLVYDEYGPGGWNRGREPGDYGEMVRTWRQQNPRSARILREGDGANGPATH
jgi:hypothetical protein